MEPRYYQREAISACWQWMGSNAGNPCIVLPTGAGKSLTMSLMIRDLVRWGKKTLLVTHTKELIEQVETTLKVIGITPSVYSAGLDRRETEGNVVLCGIQSVYSKPEIFGLRDVCFIDEAHRINPASEKTMYGQFFSGLGNCRLIGLTATPYRLGAGYICDEDSWLNEIVYEVSVRELVEKGFLCRLTSRWMSQSIDTKLIEVRNREFVDSSQEKAFLEANDAICNDVLNRTSNRNAVLIFCSGIESVKKVREFFRSKRIACGAITGDTDTQERADYLEAFKAGHIKYLANCNVLTEGFDAPNIDCVALMRATLSPGLFYQMAGRGLRLHSSKSDCLILDYGENLDRHGAIDQISPRVKGSKGESNAAAGLKPCPNCSLAVPIATKHCPECDHEFISEREDKLNRKPSKAAALSDEAEDEWVAVGSMRAAVHIKKGGDETTPKTLMVSYYAGGLAIGQPVARQWVCVEHSGFARTKAEKWWKQFTSELCPRSALDATELANSFSPPCAIALRPQKDNPKYKEVASISWDKSKIPTEEEDVF